MFLLVASALAGTTFIGWPCQRLNWGWRNVWSTCSINSFSPTSSTPDTGANAGFRATSTVGGTFQLNANGVFTPMNSATPQVLCNYAPNTGSGASVNLRNRCRRAIDAYGSLVKACVTPSTAGAPLRGPNQLATPDWLPSAGHAPHANNVAGLAQNAALCLLPAGPNTVPNLGTPETRCPGLLGWFTVVFNVCGFTNAPGLTPTLMATPATATANTPNYFATTATAVNVLPSVLSTTAAAPVSPTNGAGTFCANPPTATTWNLAGAAFRTSRCRKALDQFGRTAARCHTSPVGGNAGPAQAGGYSDPLRMLAIGAASGASVPMGMNVFAPACNMQ